MTIDQPVEDAAGLCDDLVPPLLLLPVLPKHPHKGSCTPQTPPTISRPFRDFDDQIGCWKELIKYPKNENSWFFGWTIFSNLLVCVCVVYHHVAFHDLLDIKSLSTYLTCDRLVVLILWYCFWWFFKALGSANAFPHSSQQWDFSRVCWPVWICKYCLVE